jgi:hypothetical protein
LALRCREDAVKAGISSQDLEAAAEGNLIGNIVGLCCSSRGRTNERRRRNPLTPNERLCSWLRYVMRWRPEADNQS